MRRGISLYARRKKLKSSSRTPKKPVAGDQGNNTGKSGNKGKNSRQTQQKNTGNKNRNEVTEKAGTLNKKWLIPLAFAVCIVPLITLIHEYDCGLEEFPWFSYNGNTFDFFLYYKSFFLQLTGLAILVIMAYLIPKKDHSFLKEKRSIPPMIAIGVFGIVSLASAILSAHAKQAFWGGYEQFEGCFVLLAYVVCFFFAFGYARTIELVRFVLDALMVGAFIIGVLGGFQAIGLDWTHTDLAKGLMSVEVAGKYGSDGLSINQVEGWVYATLYNPNYLGSYVPLVFPYCAYLVYRGEKIGKKVFAGVTGALMLLILYRSSSSAGYAAMLASVLVAVVLVFPYLKKKVKIIIIAAGLVGVAGLSYMLISEGIIQNVFVAKETRNLEYILNEENGVTLKTSAGKTVRATLNEEMLTDPAWAENYGIFQMITVTDADTGETIPCAYDDAEKKFKIKQDGYPPIVFYSVVNTIPPEQSNDGYEHKFSVFHVQDEEIYDWSFVNPDNKTKLAYYDENLNRINDLRIVETKGFEGMYSFASGRGYIWAHTIPVLGECILTGKGPDNFVYVYPNDDYVAKKYYGYNNETTTRPHNLYLQIWLQEGLLAVLAMVFLYLLFMIQALRLCFGKKKYVASLDDEDMIKKGINFHGVVVATAVGATGYMVAGLANDSLVAIAPVFWVMLGVGYACEAMARKAVTKRLADADHAESVPADDANE